MTTETTFLVRQISTKAQLRSDALPKFHPVLIVLLLAVVAGLGAIAVLSASCHRSWVRPPRD